MQIAENWSQLCGRVEAWEPPKGAGDSGTLTIAVERVDDVASTDGTQHRNLLMNATGKSVRVSVPASAAAKIQPRKGSTAIVNVRRGKSQDQVFAHPAHIRLTSE